jgi:molybdenum cofactor synthesis domain-containing protein
MSGAQMAKIITAAILVIGDEILSGRTKDKNIGYIADMLSATGIDLKQVRIVSDDEADIIDALNALRTRYTYVFTTGGIGPTHDDITADCVAKALNVELVEDERAMAMLLERIKLEDMNEARRRMARIPVGASLIKNAISKAPGFMIENVIVMAGVPAVMQSMLDDVLPRLQSGVKMMSETINATGLKEGGYAADLGAIQKLHSGIIIGSYPSIGEDGRFNNQIVVRSKDATSLQAASDDVRKMVTRMLSEKHLNG